MCRGVEKSLDIKATFLNKLKLSDSSMAEDTDNKNECVQVNSRVKFWKKQYFVNPTLNVLYG